MRRGSSCSSGISLADRAQSGSARTGSPEGRRRLRQPAGSPVEARRSVPGGFTGVAAGSREGGPHGEQPAWRAPCRSPFFTGEDPGQATERSLWLPYYTHCVHATCGVQAGPQEYRDESNSAPSPLQAGRPPPPGRSDRALAVWPPVAESGQMTALPLISVLVPVLDEEANVAPLVEGVREALCGTPAWELLFIDDGSTDGTASSVLALAQADPRIRLVALARNYGQTAALQAGLDHARRRIVISM